MMPDLEDWSIERVVGQLLSISVGHHDDGSAEQADTVEEVERLVAEHHIGGVCYFPSGPEGARPQTIERIVERLQAAAKTPLLISIDQEGGLVTRMREPATRWPSAMAQAAGGDLEAVRRYARAAGSELAAVGVNHVFAPVADVNIEPANPVIGLRSAGSSPALVASFVTAALQGYAEAGIATCLKHFPGHGNTSIDSHVGLPTIDVDPTRWYQGEALPFLAGIDAGADAVLIGHLRAPGLDPSGMPATFSRAIVTGLLREELGFDGVIVTDALDMAAAEFPGGPGAACVAALAAGIDQLLMPRDPAACIREILDALQRGELAEADLRASAARIFALKERLGAGSGAPPGAHAALAFDAISRALTWREEECHLALAPGEPVLLLSDPMPPSVGRGVEDVPVELAANLAERGHQVSAAGLESTDIPTDAATLIITRDAWRVAGLAEAVRERCQEAGSRLGMIAARSPYDAQFVPAGVPVLLCYGDIPGVSTALAHALATGTAEGQLPVDLPGEAPGEVAWTARIQDLT